MRQIFRIAIMVFGIAAAMTAAEAQTASDQTTSGGTGVGSDPLSVPTSSLSTGSSFSTARSVAERMLKSVGQCGGYGIEMVGGYGFEPQTLSV